MPLIQDSENFVVSKTKASFSASAMIGKCNGVLQRKLWENI